MGTPPRPTLLGPSRRPRSFLAVVAAAAVAGAAVFLPVEGKGPKAAGAFRPADPLALLGSWAATPVTSGVHLYEGLLSEGEGHWKVTFRYGGYERPQPLGSADEAAELRARLENAGYPAVSERITWPPGIEAAPAEAGWRVRLDRRFDSEHAARALIGDLEPLGFDAAAEWTGAAPDGPGRRVRTALLVVDPAEFDGRLTPTYGTELGGREEVRTLAAGEEALAAVNAGFFVMADGDGIPGTPVGIGLYGGTLLSEAVHGRAAVLLHGDGLAPAFADFHTELLLHAPEDSHPLHGLNRGPAATRDCPEAEEGSGASCTVPDELLLFTPELGAAPPPTQGVEVLLDPEYTVVEVRTGRENEPPAGEGYTVQGTGAAAHWLLRNARAGAALEPEIRLRDGGGTPLPIGPDTHIVNGGPWLLRGGKYALDFDAHGLIREEDPSFAYTWGLRRHPRTAIGVDAQGRILLLAAAGRQPGVSDGLGLHEAAALLADLGAVDAIALDGGGSTTMIVEDEPVLIGDEEERAIGDALLLTGAEAG